jgi:hypothetical protein
MRKNKPKDGVEGYLQIGVNSCGEVVVKYPDLQLDRAGLGCTIFSPRQARRFARLLVKHADSIDRKKP